MIVKELYCPKCGEEIFGPYNGEGGYATFTCYNCNTKVGVWLVVRTIKVAVPDSDSEIVESEI